MIEIQGKSFLCERKWIILRAVVIGASGHVGSYMVPELVKKGYEVVAISRGTRLPYTGHQPEWKKVKTVSADRKALEKGKTFGSFVMSFEPDVVLDLICYTKAQAVELAEAAMEYGKLLHLIQIGSIWAYGKSVYRPYREEYPRRPLGSYGKGKAEIEEYLLGLTKLHKLTCTVIHPGHICGEGWWPINPQGNPDTKVFEDIANGREIIIPNDGLATLNHVHSYDIAALAIRCLDRPSASAGEAFTSVCPEGMTLEGYAEEMFIKFGKEPKIRKVPFEQFKNFVGDENAAITYDHISKSLVCSMDKAYRHLGFVPKYDALATVGEAVDWQVRNGFLKIEK
jgi:nucleoside-diphosphate-sugar epimerase